MVNQIALCKVPALWNTVSGQFLKPPVLRLIDTIFVNLYLVDETVWPQISSTTDTLAKIVKTSQGRVIVGRQQVGQSLGEFL